MKRRDRDVTPLDADTWLLVVAVAVPFVSMLYSLVSR